MILTHDAKIKYFDLKTRLQILLKSPLSLTITDNTSSLISSRRKNLQYVVRLHHMFLDAGDPALMSLSGYLRGNSKRIGKDLELFINANKTKIRRPRKHTKPIKINLKVKGRFFNIQDAHQKINKAFFDGKVDCQITWGYRRNKRARKSIRLGSYSSKTKTIRINPVLDHSFVPEYVLNSIIYHEMLHNLIGSKERNGRNLHHHHFFREMEKKFPQNDRARQWVRKNLTKLLKA